MPSRLPCILLGCSRSSLTGGADGPTKMRADLAALNARLAGEGKPPICIGIGINTGWVLAAQSDRASARSTRLSAITVNLASRVEGLNKQYPVYDILLSQWTWRRCAMTAESSSGKTLVTSPFAARPNQCASGHYVTKHGSRQVPGDLFSDQAAGVGIQGVPFQTRTLGFWIDPLTKHLSERSNYPSVCISPEKSVP